MLPGIAEAALLSHFGIGCSVACTVAASQRLVEADAAPFRLECPAGLVTRP